MPTRKKDRSTPEGRRAAYMGQWFRNRRVQVKRTLQECAEVCSYSVSTLSEMERGFYDPMRFSLKAIPSLAIAYNVRPEAILWRLGIIEPPSTSDWEYVKRMMDSDAEEEKTD